MRLTSIVLTAVLFGAPVTTFAGTGQRCYPDCPGGYFLNQTPYPFTEHIVNSTGITVDSGTWKTIVTGCSSWNGQELRATEAFRMIVRGGLTIHSTSGQVGTRYEIGLFVDGAQMAAANKAFKPTYDTTVQPPRVRVLWPLAEIIAANWPDTQAGVPPPAAGNHTFEMKARMVDPGSFVVTDAFINAQGVPAAQYANRRVVSGYEATLSTTSFLSATPSVVVTNSTPATMEIFPQAYFQHIGGTPGAKIETKFRLQESGGLGRVIESNVMNVYVPCPTMASDGTCSFPAGPRDSQPILGPRMNVPPNSTWTLSLLAKSAASGTRIAWRYTDYITLPAVNGVNNRYWQAILTTPVTVRTNTPTTPQPQSGPLAYWSDWTEILNFDVPWDGGGSYENAIASLYLELYRHPNALAGNWVTEQITVAVEARLADGTYWEWGKFDLPLNKGSQTHFLFSDAFLFGIASSGNTQIPAATFRVFIRKGYPVTGQYSEFEVRNAGIHVKRVPGTPHGCYVRPPG